MTRVVLSTALLVSIGAQATALDMALHITVPKRNILVGEPIKIVTRWVASASVNVRKRAAEVMVDRGQGFVRWSEAQPVEGTVLSWPQRLDPGGAEVTEHVVAVAGPTRQGAYYTLAFPAPGEYHVLVRYRLGTQYVTSNVATVSASAPAGRDAQLLELIRREPETLVARQPNLGRRERLEQLFSDYPGTPLLSRARIIHLNGCSMKPSDERQNQCRRPDLCREMSLSF